MRFIKKVVKFRPWNMRTACRLCCVDINFRVVHRDKKYDMLPTNNVAGKIAVTIKLSSYKWIVHGDRAAHIRSSALPTMHTYTFIHTQNKKNGFVLYQMCVRNMCLDQVHIIP